MKRTILSVFAGLLMVVTIGSVQSQAGSFEVGVYGGIGESLDSDVKYNAGDGNFTNKNVEWDGDPFGPAPYWGVRLTYWPESMRKWGFMLDYTHAKLIAEPDSGGTPNIGSRYDRLEFTDGLNLVTANLVYKFDKIGGLQPYAGAGIGLSIPHVEVTRNGSKTAEYQITGVAAQVLVGTQYDLGNNFSLFGEYKFSYAEIDADLTNGGTLDTDAMTNHVIFGLSYKFGGK